MWEVVRKCNMGELDVENHSSGTREKYQPISINLAWREWLHDGREAVVGPIP